MPAIESRRDGPEAVSGLNTEDTLDHGDGAMAVEAAI